MCTVSWRRAGDDYDLLCNRDESRLRKIALPPAVRETRGVRYLAPADGDFGGTWIGANELGVSVCLLNRYVERTTDHVRTSRGLLVADLMDASSRGAVRDRLAVVDLDRFDPFTLVVLEPGEPAAVTTWTGRHTLVECDADALMPLVSSGYDPEGVVAARRALLAEQLGGRAPSVDDLVAYHRSHVPEPGPLSVCMHREDAHTVSFTHVRVRASRVALAYVDGSPCAEAGRAVLALERRTVGAPALT
jgi:hypothetical protein